MKLKTAILIFFVTILVANAQQQVDYKIVIKHASSIKKKSFNIKPISKKLFVGLSSYSIGDNVILPNGKKVKIKLPEKNIVTSNVKFIRRNYKLEDGIITKIQDTSIKYIGKKNIVYSLPPQRFDKTTVSLSNYDINQGLGNSYVQDIDEDSLGLLWFSTAGGGVNVFDGMSFNIIDEQNGLSSNNINKTYLDSKNNMWIATRFNGVCKYDGVRITTLNKSNGLPGNTVTSITEDKKGRIWIGTNLGLCIIQDSIVINLEKQFKTSLSVSCLVTDNYGNIWFTRDGEGVYKYNWNGFLHYTKENGLIGNKVHDLYVGNGKNIWISTSEGLSKFDGRYFYNYTKNQGLPSNNISCVMIDQDSSMWVGTKNDGLCHLVGNKILYINEATGLSDNEITDIFQDSYGVIWISTFGGGVNRYDGDLFTKITKEQGIKSNLIISLIQDRKKNIWLSMEKCYLSKFDGTYLTNYKLPTCKNDDGIYGIAEYKNNEFWLITNKVGVWRLKDNTLENINEKSGFFCDKFYAIYKDKENNLWFGGVNGEIIKFDGVNYYLYKINKFDRYGVFCISQDSKGRMWFGTWGNGAFILDKGKLTKLTTVNGLAINYIYNFFEDKNGYMWISTSNGLSIYNNGRFVSFNKKRGLTNNNCYWTIQQNKNTILVGTESGLTQFIENKEGENNNIDENYSKSVSVFSSSYYIRQIKVSDGFTGGDCVGSANPVLIDKNKNIWIPTGKHLCIFKPKGVINNKRPKVIFTGIDVYFKRVNWLKYINKSSHSYFGNRFNYIQPYTHIPDSLSLTFKNNQITFNYRGLYHKHYNNLNYRYKLEGLDKHWSPITGQTSVTYSNLAPGNYKFMVQAITLSGVTSLIKKYPFIVRTPWWMNIWFDVLFVFVVIFLIVLIITWRIKRIKQQREKLERIVKQRTADMFHQKEELLAQRDRLDEINSELEKLSIVARETNNGVLIADSRGNIEWVNYGFTKLLGYTFDELRINKGPNLFFQYKNESSFEYFNKCRDTKEPVQFTQQYQTNWGEKLWVQITLTPILGENNQIYRYIAIYADISEVKQAQDIISRHNMEITSSIRYASRIQAAVLPSTRVFRKSDIDSFIIYKPKDIVGGDFYWFSEHNGNYLIGVFDCTGHGVPGAFMTLISYSILNAIVNDETVTEPGKILGIMNNRVRKMLKQNQYSENTLDDGLDASLCYIDLNANQVRFSGAMQNLYVVDSNGLTELKGDRQSLGYAYSKSDYKFTNHEFNFTSETMFYLSTDGYKDMPYKDGQLPLGKKTLKKILSNIYYKSLKEQKRYLLDIIRSVHSKSEQRDDITLIGFKMHNILNKD